MNLDDLTLTFLAFDGSNGSLFVFDIGQDCVHLVICRLNIGDIQPFYNWDCLFFFLYNPGLSTLLLDKANLATPSISEFSSLVPGQS